MKYDVFISYSSLDQKVAEGICGFLESHGVRCFVAFRDIPPGKVWASEIVKGLDASSMMVIVYSQNFNCSEQVDREIELAAEDHKPMLTYRLSDSQFEGAKKYYLKNINWIDAFPEPENFFGKLLENVKRLLPQDESENKVATNTTNQFMQPSPSTQQGLMNSVLKVSTDLNCRIFVDGEERGVATANNVTRITLRGGSYRLRFVAVENSNFVVEEKFFHIDRDSEELYSVELMAQKKEEERRKEYLLQLPDDVFIPKKISEGKWHYVDKEDKELIPFIYDYVFSFSEGLAAVRKNRRYGFIDKTGREVIPLIYDDAGFFIKGIARVEKNRKWGFINNTGREIIPLIYDYADHFSGGLAAVKKNWKYGFIDKTGREVIPFIYDNSYPFIDDLAMVRKDGKWGYIDKTGREVIPFIYDNSCPFIDDLTKVLKDGKWGYIDKTGREVIPFIYDDSFPFSEGLAAVRKNSKYGFIDKTGREIIPFIYDDADSFRNGLAKVRKYGKWGYIDKTGKWVEDA